jgi:signal peptidase II
VQERGTVASLRSPKRRADEVGRHPDALAAAGPPPADPGARLRLVLGLAVAVVVLDQLTKTWALSALADGPVDLVGTLRLNLTYNTAGAFGLGGGLVPLLALAALGVVVYLIVSGAANSRLPVAIAMGLLLGGAVGNLADRVFRAPGLLRGAVVDLFNVADMGITCGCVMLFLWAGRSSTLAESGAAA